MSRALAALAALVVCTSGGTLIARASPPSALVDVDGAVLTPHAADGYHRGKRKRIEVVTLGWAEVEVRTARAFLAMRAAAAADGIELWVHSGFRTMEQQRWLYDAWKAGWGAKAARPGRSNHQSGLALDLGVLGPGTYAWLEANARRFGFRRTVPDEPWHWEYTPPRKRHRRR